MSYIENEYTLCALCDHFIELNESKSQDFSPTDYIHLEDGNQDFDHDATPSDQTYFESKWEKIRPDLFTEYPDGAVGPNSSHHDRRGKVDYA